MQYYIGADHAGLEIKNFIVGILQKKGYIVKDMGPFDTIRVDYPDYAESVCHSIQKHEKAFGILVCGSGIGMSIAANKFHGIRAALCYNEYAAKMAREHNDANVLCLGERVSGYGMVEAIIDAWDNANFQEGRHQNRVEKINAFDKS